MRKALPPIALPPVDEAVLQHVEDALGDDWDDERLGTWMAQDPVGAAGQIKAWGALDMQFLDEHYGCGGWSPLMIATSIREVEPRRACVAALIAQGANVHARTVEGTSVLGIAMMTGDLDVVKQLLAAGADPTVASVVGITPLHHATYSQRAFATYVQGMTVALPGVGDPVELARVLLDAGANPNAASLNDGTTPLQFIVMFNPDLSTIELLAQRGADLFVRRMGGQRHDLGITAGDTLLHMARNAPRAVFQGLLRMGLDPHARNDLGATPLAVVIGGGGWGDAWGRSDDAMQDRLQVAFDLLALGADPNVADEDGHSAWTHLVQDVVHGGPKVLDLLRPLVVAMVDAGASMDAIVDPEVPSVTCAQRLMGMREGRDDEAVHRRWVEGLEVRAAAVSVASGPAIRLGARPRL